MQISPGIPDIHRRARRIGLSLKTLAERAGIDPSTAYRGCKGEQRPLKETVDRLLGELVTAERALLAELRERYPGEAA